MYHDFTYERVLAASRKAQWKLDDVLPEDRELDFDRNFLPDSLAGTNAISGITDEQRRTLNQICAYEYLFFFGVFEQYVVPFVLENQEQPAAGGQPGKTEALANFAEEERKHIHLFERYRAAFDRRFPVRCQLVNSEATIPVAMEQAHPIAGALFVLLFEWMTQSHYVDAVRDNNDIDPLFKSLLKYHWMEEAQHAKLDTLIVDDLVNRSTRDELPLIISDFKQLYMFIDKGLRIQANYKVNAFEQATGRRIPNREVLAAHLYQSALWAFVGCGAVHPRFRATVRSISTDFEHGIDRWTKRQFGQRLQPQRSIPVRRAAANA